MPKKGYKRTEEHQRKISEANRGKKRLPRSAEWTNKIVETRRKNGSYKHSEETKRKISEALKGEKNPNFGKPCSEERKRKSRETQIGIPKWTEEDKKRMSEQRRGNKYALGKHHKLSLETRKRQSECKKGEKSYLWKGGVSPKNRRIRLGIEFRLWRDEVFKRDNYTCQKYGIRGQKGFGKRVILHPHHIQNFADFPELRFEVSNGITLSKQAHEEFHKKYGTKNNTKEQLEEFLCEKK